MKNKTIKTIKKGNNKITIVELKNNELFLKENKEEIDNGNLWDFPIEEIEYLLQDHNGETFVKIDNRLFEMN